MMSKSSLSINSRGQPSASPVAGSAKRFSEFKKSIALGKRDFGDRFVLNKSIVETSDLPVLRTGALHS